SGGVREGSAARGWQDRAYGGVSPAMRRGDYGKTPRFGGEDYTASGRFYGDDGERVYGEEYGYGPRDLDQHGPTSGYDAAYSPTRARYHAEGYGEPGYGGYRSEFRSTRPASGGTGGYDYERGYGYGYGYGDNSRRESRSDRFEDAGRKSGEFLHRAGEKVAAWFAGGSEARAYAPGDDQPASRGARGLGPQGYKRADERISDDAHERLTDDAWLDASNITLTVSGGEITLSGTVENRESKHHAERLVETISGVNHVQNNLRLEKGNYFTSPGSGYGDSVLGAQIRAADDEPATNGTGGAGGGQSSAGRKN
ncbi:BON domain-containing protein, partial [Phenylobacterium sp.]|uniref:BON domain-containing protein n=1 Tax=Phenylobacterium sp. TaxID=1871053 RepID=UPI0012012D4F